MTKGVWVVFGKDAYIARFQDNGSGATYLRQINPDMLNNSISELNNNFISVYPNPSYGMFHISSNSNASISNVIVSDLTGRIVYNSIYNNNEVVIDLSDLSVGTYYSTITTNSQVSYKNLVIIK